jgi:adenylate cyclase class 2
MQAQDFYKADQTPDPFSPRPPNGVPFMLEIEQKYSQADFEAIEHCLAEWSVTSHEDVEEADDYYNAPDRDFRQTNEAFRLRRVGLRNFLTYKGPKQLAAMKVRTELEVPLPDGDEAAAQFGELLKLLGYCFVATVKKKRRTYKVRREAFMVAICLDEVAGLGRFAEVEIVAPDKDRDQALLLLSQLAKDLHLFAVEPRSYLGLILEKK